MRLTDWLAGSHLHNHHQHLFPPPPLGSEQVQPTNHAVQQESVPQYGRQFTDGARTMTKPHLSMCRADQCPLVSKITSVVLCTADSQGEQVPFWQHGCSTPSGTIDEGEEGRVTSESVGWLVGRSFLNQDWLGHREEGRKKGERALFRDTSHSLSQSVQKRGQQPWSKERGRRRYSMALAKEERREGGTRYPHKNAKDIACFPKTFLTWNHHLE